MSTQNIDDIINNEVINKSILTYSSDEILQYNVTRYIWLKKIYHIMWHILHSFSTQYPENPTEDEKNIVKIFLSNFKENMPFFCSTCSNNKQDVFIQSYNLDLAVNSRNNLITFFCDYHIEVNTKYRKLKEEYNSEIYTPIYIINKYSDNSYSEYITTKYNINLYDLFINNKMNDFFTLFNNNIINSIKSEKFNITINILKET